MSASRRLRCLTFNLWKNEGDLGFRLGAIGRVLARSGADVIALQECFVASDLAIDVAARLAEEGGYHLHRRALREKVRHHGGQAVASRSDLALLTREPVAAAGWIPLSSDPRDGDRGLIWADYPVTTGQVRVVCTHLTHLGGADGRALRERQAEQVAARLTSWTRFGPAVLLGDLNAAAGAPELAALLDNPLLPAHRTPPAGASAGCGLRQAEEVDHVVLYPGGVPIHYLDLRALTDPAHEPAAGWASDHPALLAELDFA